MGDHGRNTRIVNLISGISGPIFPEDAIGEDGSATAFPFRPVVQTAPVIFGIIAAERTIDDIRIILSPGSTVVANSTSITGHIGLYNAIHCFHPADTMIFTDGINPTPSPFCLNVLKMTVQYIRTAGSLLNRFAI